MAITQRKSNALALPDDVVAILAAQDKRKNFPPGTMQSLMTQEIGGQESKYLKDITAYHYAPNAEGKRIAGQTGKVSTAFGPFGLLDSTSKDPGYGVTPLGDRSSFAEQARFSADYLDGRSKAAGSLNAGLAGYGQGKPYSDQVVARRDNTRFPNAEKAPVPVAPVVAAAAATPQAAPVAPVVVAQADALPVAATPAVAQADAWQEFLARSRAAGAPTPAPVMPQQFAYQPMPIAAPDFLSMVSYMNKERAPSQGFQGLQGFGGMGAAV